MKNQSISYRPEIDGLRAIAVLFVVFFHADFSGFGGGFLGVDIFFVISGYLITYLILNGIDTSSFKLSNFYERRARRILPVLFLVTLICIPFGIFLMQPNDLENLGQNIVATILMSNNLLQAITSGYWDFGSEIKPLFHTWSLGVEEQFYVIFPIFLILIVRYFKNYLGLFLACLFLVSFLISVIFSQTNPDFNFYSPFSRGWELLAGSLAAYIHLYKKDFIQLNNYARELILVTSFLMLFASVFLFSELESNPNHLTLPTIFSTFILILFLDSATFVGRILSHNFLLKIGLMSYSIYLWHQPIFAFMRISMPSVEVYYYFIAIFFIIVLSAFSLTIENFFRSFAKLKTALFIKIISVASFFLLVSGLLFHFSSGFYNSYDELKSDFSVSHNGNKNRGYVESANKFFNKPFYNDNSKKIVFIGDSYARDSLNILRENEAFSKYNFSILKGNCKTSHSPDLGTLLDISNLSFVIISYRELDSVQRQCLLKHLQFMKEKNIKFIIFGTKDFGINMSYPLKRKKYDYLSAVNQDILEFYSWQKNNLKEYDYIDLFKVFDLKELYIPVFTDDKKLITTDGAHLTQHGAKFAAKKISAISMPDAARKQKE